MWSQVKVMAFHKAFAHHLKKLHAHVCRSTLEVKLILYQSKTISNIWREKSCRGPILSFYS